MSFRKFGPEPHRPSRPYGTGNAGSPGGVREIDVADDIAERVTVGDGFPHGVGADFDLPAEVVSAVQHPRFGRMEYAVGSGDFESFERNVHGMQGRFAAEGHHGPSLSERNAFELRSPRVDAPTNPYVPASASSASLCPTIRLPGGWISRASPRSVFIRHVGIGNEFERPKLGLYQQRQQYGVPLAPETVHRNVVVEGGRAARSRRASVRLRPMRRAIRRPSPAMFRA